MIDIQSLLKEFDGEIIERGKAYYHDGRVVELKKVFPGEYHAKVAAPKIMKSGLC